MDLAFLSGSRVGTRRSVLALQSTPRRAKKWFSVVPLCLMPWRIGRGYLHRYSRYFLAVDPWRSDITKSTFAVRNIIRGAKYQCKVPAKFQKYDRVQIIMILGVGTSRPLMSAMTALSW